MMFSLFELTPLLRMKIHDESSSSSIGYLGYLGFAGQLSWTIILVYLPIIEKVVGGTTFAYTLSLAMGFACNIVRFGVVCYGRYFSFHSRIIFGSVLSAIFTFGYFAVYLSSPEPSPSAAIESWGFWVGLLIALIGGAGNAQLMSTGYGVASIVSIHRPIANTIFFFGQAVASAFCWPIKTLVEVLTSVQIAQIGISMTAVSLISLSIIPIYKLRISKYARLEIDSGGSVSWSNAIQVFRKAMFPLLCLWLTYFCTNLVTPGQLMQWSVPVDNENDLLSDGNWYKSFCCYIHLLSDAVGKSCVVVVALEPRRMQVVMSSKWIKISMALLVVARICMLPIFYFPPDNIACRFVFLVIFSLMNGVTASVAVSLCSASVDSGETDMAGYLSSFTIINGLFVGSLAGMLVRFTIQS
jgi:hypothetical protein